MAALCFAGLICAYMLPVLIGAKILSPNALMYQWSPWQFSYPKNVGSFYNTLLTDIPESNYPWRLFAREQLHQGTIPQWFPNVFGGGAPLLSNPQVGLFTPFNLPVWLLPINYGLGLSAALKLWAAAFGNYLLARQLRLGWLPGMLAGAGFAFCAYNVVWLTHETLPAVVVMLPWIVWLLERLFERGRISTALWLGLAVAIAIGGGHPGAQIHVLVLAGLYAWVRVWLVPDHTDRGRLRLLGLALGAIGLGILLMAVMLIPEALSSHGTVGTSSRVGGAGTLPGSTMPFDAIKTALFPDWWGRPSSMLVDGSAKSAGYVTNFNERTFYTGVVVALFALIGVFSSGGWLRKGPFVMIAVLGLAIPLHAPPLWQLVTHLPPLNVVQNQRLLFAYAFGASVLAAFGLQNLLDRPAAQLRNLIIPGVAVGLGVVVLLTIGPSGADIDDTVTHFTSGTNFRAARVLELTSAVWFLIFAVGVAVAVALTFRRPSWRHAIAVGVVLLAAADGLHFAKGLQPMGKASEVIPPRTGAIDYLTSHARSSRINGLGNTELNLYTNPLGTSWSTTYGLSDIRGYAPPNPTKRMLSLWRRAAPYQVDWMPLGMSNQGPNDVQVESVLGAKYIITDPGIKLDPAARRDPVVGGLRVVYAGKDAKVLENPRAAPRVELPKVIELASDRLDAETRIVNPKFYPKDNVVIETSDPAARVLAKEPVAHGTVRIAKDQAARVTLDATLDRTGLVVLNDNLTDGWTVKVDGRKAEPVRVNSLMRGVVAGPGRHTIVWSYMTPGLKAGAAISLLALLGLIGGAVLLGLRTRRGGKPLALSVDAPPSTDEAAVAGQEERTARRAAAPKVGVKQTLPRSQRRRR